MLCIIGFSIPIQIESEELPGEESEAPTEEMVEKTEEQLEAAESDLKNLFLIIFQRFIMLLSEHIQKCESQGKPFKTHWFRWTIGRLQQVFFEVSLYQMGCAIKASLSLI